MLETSGGSLDITGGARALYLDGDVSVSGLGAPIAESESGTNWDAVIGFRGETNINEVGMSATTQTSAPATVI